MQTRFSRHNKVRGVFELKITKKPSIRFAALPPHQERALVDSNGTAGCAHKISDFSYDQKPFDCFRISEYPAYVVVWFYAPRQKKPMYYIPINHWLGLRAMLEPRKSAKEFEIAEVSTHQIIYKD